MTGRRLGPCGREVPATANTTPSPTPGPATSTVRKRPPKPGYGRRLRHGSERLAPGSAENDRYRQAGVSRHRRLQWSLWRSGVAPEYPSDMTDDREQDRARRDILVAYVAVMDRPEELLAVCANASGDADDVRRAIERAFEISAVAADAILSMPVRRFTPAERRRIQDELRALNAGST